jgi:hypothetical protein
MSTHLPTAAFKRLAGLFFLLLLFVKGNTQTIFPVQASTRVLTPYSVYLADYAVNGNDKLQSVLINRDAAQTTYQVILRLTVKLNGQVIMRSRAGFAPQPITLAPQTPVVVAGATLEPYLKSENLDFIGYSQALYEQNRALPEGFYEICFSAYDFFRPDVQVSNDGCGFYYLAKNEPPLINLPSCGGTIAAQFTTPIRFSWVPRNNASLNSFNNTKYKLYLYEVNPATLNPNDVVNSVNPVFMDSTPINQTFYDLMPTPVIFRDTFLYVWRVQAVDAGGVDLFRNNGYSEVCTFKWGGANAANGAIDSVLNLNAAAEAPRKAKIWWTKDPAKFDAYKIYYKKAGNGFNWFTVETTADSIRVTDLEPNTEYQVRMQGKKDGSYGLYSALRYFKTPAIVPRNCDSEALLDSSLSPRPITVLSSGAMVTYHEFDININEFEPLGQPGYYKIKKGTVSIPFFAGRLFGLTSQSVFINDQNIITQGTVVFDSKDLQAWIDDRLNDDFGGNDVGDVVSGDDGADYTLNYPISGPGAIRPVLPITNGVTDLIITRPDGTRDTLRNVPLPTTIKDVNGNIYGVDKDGKVTYIGKSGTLTGIDPAKLNKPSLNKARVTFSATSDQIYAFDAWNPAYAGKFRVEREYEKLVDSANLNLPPYYVSNKAIGAAKQDAVLATVAITDASIIADSIKFVTGRGTQFAATKTTNPNEYKVQLVGGPGGDAQELFAVYKLNGEWVSFGKLKVAGYDAVYKTVVFVPVNGKYPNVGAIQRLIDKVYKPINIHIAATLTENFEDTSWYKGTDTLLHVTGSGAFSQYSQDMKRLYRSYKQEKGTQKDVLYVFSLSKSNEQGVVGDMPLGGQFGYLFMDEIGNDTALLAKTACHELAHGIFRLHHVFEPIIGINKGSSDNLMDYPGGINTLKYQWDQIHDPGSINGLFLKDEDVEFVTVRDISELDDLRNKTNSSITDLTFTFISPSGKPITLPKDITSITFSYGDEFVSSANGNPNGTLIPIGSLTNFTSKSLGSYILRGGGNNNALGYIKFTSNTKDNSALVDSDFYTDVISKHLTITNVITASPVLRSGEVLFRIGLRKYTGSQITADHKGEGNLTNDVPYLMLFPSNYTDPPNINATTALTKTKFIRAKFSPEYGVEALEFLKRTLDPETILAPYSLVFANQINRYPNVYTTCITPPFPKSSFSISTLIMNNHYRELARRMYEGGETINEARLLKWQNYETAIAQALPVAVFTLRDLQTKMSNINAEALSKKTQADMIAFLKTLDCDCLYKQMDASTKVHVLKTLCSSKVNERLEEKVYKVISTTNAIDYPALLKAFSDNNGEIIKLIEKNLDGSDWDNVVQFIAQAVYAIKKPYPDFSQMRDLPSLPVVDPKESREHYSYNAEFSRGTISENCKINFIVSSGLNDQTGKVYYETKSFSECLLDGNFVYRNSTRYAYLDYYELIGLTISDDIQLGSKIKLKKGDQIVVPAIWAMWLNKNIIYKEKLKAIRSLADIVLFFTPVGWAGKFARLISVANKLIASIDFGRTNFESELRSALESTGLSANQVDNIIKAWDGIYDGYNKAQLAFLGATVFKNFVTSFEALISDPNAWNKFKFYYLYRADQLKQIPSKLEELYRQIKAEMGLVGSTTSAGIGVSLETIPIGIANWLRTAKVVQGFESVEQLFAATTNAQTRMNLYNYLRLWDDANDYLKYRNLFAKLDKALKEDANLMYDFASGEWAATQKMLDKFEAFNRSGTGRETFGQILDAERRGQLTLTQSFKNYLSRNVQSPVEYLAIHPEVISSIKVLKQNSLIRNGGSATEEHFGIAHRFTKNGDFLNWPMREGGFTSFPAVQFGEYELNAYKALVEALRKWRLTSRSFAGRTVYRGMSFKQADYDALFNSGANEVKLKGFQSCSKTTEAPMGFWQIQNGEVKVMFKIKTKNGVDISDISDWGDVLGPINHSGATPPSIIVQREILLEEGVFKIIGTPVPKTAPNGQAYLEISLEETGQAFRTF